MLSKIKPYILPVIIPLAVGGLAAFLTRGNMNIYSEINVPPLSPPMWLFPIVWSILYFLMGISSGMIYARRSARPEEVRSALSVYALSLALNFSWSLIFFNLRYFLLSLAVILALLASIIATVRLYSRISKVAAYLQIPYAIWVAFATYLNAAIWVLNRM